MPLPRVAVVVLLQRATRPPPQRVCRPSSMGRRPLGRAAAAVAWASEASPGCTLGDTTSCRACLRAMDVASAHPCTLQSIIHDDGAVEKATGAVSVGG